MPPVPKVPEVVPPTVAGNATAPIVGEPFNPNPEPMPTVQATETTVTPAPGPSTFATNTEVREEKSERPRKDTGHSFGSPNSNPVGEENVERPWEEARDKGKPTSFDYDEVDVPEGYIAPEPPDAE